MPINLTRSVSSLSGVPFPKGSNVYGSLPCLGGSHAPGVFPLPEGDHVSNGLPFHSNFNISRIFPFLCGTYPPSNLWKQGGNYFPRENTYHGGYSSTPSPYIGGPYGPFGINMSLPLG